MSAADQSGMLWRKSSACAPTECVEVAFDREQVFVRDSKNREQAILEFTCEEWRTFLANQAHWRAIGNQLER